LSFVENCPVPELPSQPQLEPLTRTQVLAAMGVTAVLLLLVARLWLMFDPVDLLSPHWASTDLLIGVSLGGAISAASAVIYRLWKDYRESADFYLTLVLKPLSWIDVIWLGLLPGLSEELLFRGVMLPAIGLNWFGLLISSLCFGILHFSGSQQWSYVIWATLIGGVLGFSVLETGNLLVPIAAHITTNLLSSYIWKLSDDSHADPA
jgi:uncharacterized protein